jgi:5-methyltetrahydropteroyltriglutamate--homocysteine methyltransferase
MRQTNPDRILTTHVGSLPRPPEMVELLKRRESGRDYDPRAFDAALSRAVADVVKRQVAIGIDLVDDGEIGKTSYATYIQERLAGFGPIEDARWRAERHREHDAFPEYYARTAAATGPESRRKLGCVAPIATHDREPLRRDLANLKAAAAAAKPFGTFMTAASPGVIARFHPNAHYATGAAYRRAVGEAMQEEYEAIAAAGFILQVDCPDLASGRNTVFAALSDEEFLRESAISIEILNDALRNVPAEQTRLHLCWGNYEGPHIHDIDLEKILPGVLKAKPQVISFEGANPRHGHEWEVWHRIKLPDDKAIMPGVIDSLTNYVEHPQLVAQRIGQYADAVGRERVIAAVDCGFETFAGTGRIDPRIVYAKLEALVAGARIASEKLWGKGI